VRAFTPDSARELGGDPAAAERATALAMPTAEEEVWRYSRIGELDLDRFVPGRADTTVTGADGLTGEAADVDVDERASDVFDELNSAFHAPVVIRVPRGRTVADPIVVTHIVDGEGVAVFPRLVVEAGEDSEVTVVEQFVSANGARSLVVPRLEIRAQQSARVRYLAVNVLNQATWQIAHQRAIGERDTNTLLATVALGGDYARVRTDARLVGQGGTTRQIALYYADCDQMPVGPFAADLRREVSAKLSRRQASSERGAPHRGGARS
jgi:Fe-S cluster assembly protein SufD